jgi:hypothetical protein
MGVSPMVLGQDAQATAQTAGLAAPTEVDSRKLVRGSATRRGLRGTCRRRHSSELLASPPFGQPAKGSPKGGREADSNSHAVHGFARVFGSFLKAGTTFAGGFGRFLAHGTVTWSAGGRWSEVAECFVG